MDEDPNVGQPPTSAGSAAGPPTWEWQAPRASVGCTARRCLRHCSGAPSRARSADPSRQPRRTRPVHSVERVGDRDQPGADPAVAFPPGPPAQFPELMSSRITKSAVRFRRGTTRAILPN